MQFTLEELRLLNSTSEEEYDNLTQLAARILQVPIAHVSVLDTEAGFVHYKSQTGHPAELAALGRLPMEQTYCQHVPLSGQAVIAPNAAEHPLLQEAARSAPDLPQAYMGIPIYTPDDEVVGGLCMMQPEPRAWTEDEITLAENFGRCVSDLIKYKAAVLTSERLHEQLSSANAKFGNYARLSSNWMWELDEHLCYTWHSSHEKPLAGSNALELVGKARDLELNGMVVDDEQLRQHNERLKNHEFIDVVLSWKPDNGRMVYSHVLAEPQFDQSGDFTGYLGCGRNITERKILEDQIIHSRKMESIGQLAAGIAHEINTPAQFVGDNTRFLHESFEDISNLNKHYKNFLAAARNERITPALIAQVENAEKDADIDYLETEIPVAIEQTLEGIGRISRIVLAMKEFSHPGTEEKRPVDLNRIIENTITISANEWKYVASMETDLANNLPKVCCHEQEISQVILNMIVNAAHAIEEKNEDRTPAKEKITIMTQTQGGAVSIVIEDTGNGISDGNQPRIFDPFFTTKDVGRGTGQGLSMAYTSIVDNHGGQIDVHSEPGTGTKFTIQLPVSPKSSRELAA
jgi:signal transduction histidine kinase